MYENEDYLNDKKVDNTEMQRKFLFSKPVVLYKIKLDEILGDDTIAIKVEFLGLDRTTKYTVQDPFNGGKIFKRKYSYMHILQFSSFIDMSLNLLKIIEKVIDIFRNGLGSAYLNTSYIYNLH